MGLTKILGLRCLVNSLYGTDENLRLKMLSETGTRTSNSLQFAIFSIVVDMETRPTKLHGSSKTICVIKGTFP